WIKGVKGTGEQIEVFDCTGSYGVNLLGHENRELAQFVGKLTGPAFILGSLRQEGARLSYKINQLMNVEEARGDWVTLLTNTGAESVEVALKIAHFRFKANLEEKIIKLNIKKNLVMEDLKFRFKLGQVKVPDFNSILIASVKKLDLAIDLNNEETLEGLLRNVEAVFNYGLLVLESEYKIFAIKNSFHGKTMGALRVTYGPQYKKNIEDYINDSSVIFINPNDIGDFNEKLNQIKLCYLDFDGGRPIPEFHLPIPCMIIEPIQGEGGVIELNQHFLREIREVTEKNKIMLVLDEIQSGCFRTGTFAAVHEWKIQGDIYCFSKALGGGVSKIGAVVINRDFYPAQYDMIHSSTFGEDSFSSAVALKTITILERDKELAKRSSLKQKLMNLQKKFPELIDEVRGKGLLLGIKISISFVEKYTEFKTFHDCSLLGYLFSSALLHNEKVRAMPSLSDQLLIRIEPSLYTTEKEEEFIIERLESFFIELKMANMPYFFSCLFPGEKIGPGEELFRPKIEHDPLRPKVYFFTHFIDLKHIGSFFPSFKEVSGVTLKKHLAKIEPFLSPTITYADILKFKSGKEVEIIFVGLPLTTETILEKITSDQYYDLVIQLQSFINSCDVDDNITFGLGQFTSIMTKNGHAIKSNGHSLTTGNAFTTALAVEGMLKICREKRVEPSKSTIACLGICGNIVSVAAEFFADHFQKMIWIHHTDIHLSAKFQETVFDLLGNIINSNPESGSFASRMVELIQKFPFYDIEGMLNFLKREEVCEVLTVTTETHELLKADTIFSATNAPKPIIFPQHLKHNAIVVDIGVPKNVTSEVERTRQDVSVIYGGLAMLEDLLNTDIPNFKFPKRFPKLPDGVFYGCLAETISLALNGQKGRKNVGRITKKQVLEVADMGKQLGFKT
ncbi:MAG: aminotransferase class III-fold pyridoxal phosphate-dependent enzyme, partial [Bacteriovoracales bacterium]